MDCGQFVTLETPGKAGKNSIRMVEINHRWNVEGANLLAKAHVFSLCAIHDRYPASQDA
jgi:hypothetical protein